MVDYFMAYNFKIWWVGARERNEYSTQNNTLPVLINKSRAALPNEILMPFLSFSDILLQDAYTVLKKMIILR